MIVEYEEKSERGCMFFCEDVKKWVKVNVIMWMRIVGDK